MPPPQTDPFADRDYQGVIVFGAQGFGKTSLAEEWIERYQSQGRRVVGLDPSKQFEHRKEFEWRPARDSELPIQTATRWLAKLKRARFHGLIVLDDADAYLGAAANAEWKQFFVSYRHFQMDWMIISRRPQDIPKIAISSAGTVALFHTRGYEARTAVARNLDMPDIWEHVPKQRFQYALVDADAEDEASAVTIRKTKQRAVKTAADSKEVDRGQGGFLSRFRRSWGDNPRPR